MARSDLPPIRPNEPLGLFLVRADIISREQLYEALRIQKREGGRLGDILFKLKYVGEDDLSVILSHQLGIAYVAPEALAEIPSQAIAAVPANLVAEHQVVPFRIEDRKLCVAICDQKALNYLDEIGYFTGFGIKPFLTTPKAVGEAMRKHYGLGRSEPPPTAERVEEAREEIYVLTEKVGPAPKGIVDYAEAIFKAHRVPEIHEVLAEFSHSLFDWTGIYGLAGRAEVAHYEDKSRCPVAWKSPKTSLLDLPTGGGIYLGPVPEWAGTGAVGWEMFLCRLVGTDAQASLWIGLTRVPLAEATRHDLEILAKEARTALQLV